MRIARRLTIALSALAASTFTAGSATAQQPLSVASSCTARDMDSLTAAQAALLNRAAFDPIVGCLALDAMHRRGDYTVAVADTVRGNIVVVDGTLLVRGTVVGSAVALNGAVIVDSSGHVTGDVVSAEHGSAIAPAGRIDGELRTLDAIQPLTVAPRVSAAGSVITDLKQTAAWFGLLILLAIGVLINAGDAMQRVNTALNAGFSRNVTVGVLAQMAMLPTLVVICLLLSLTLIGILLVPFAIVAYVIAVLGLVVLGGISAMQMVGGAVMPRRPGTTERGARLQALVTGMVLLSVPWLIAALLSSMPVAAAWLRTLALGITWVAVTAGLGAALRTRGGTRSHDDPWGILRARAKRRAASRRATEARMVDPDATHRRRGREAHHGHHG
ncbi:MAG: polymer-forming cytoskeletal protein [Gemmatimonadaceae bacterium]|nr:polymer-forming cytoskeletal protein [Gemmatimonadaceae bacterium]